MAHYYELKARDGRRFSGMAATPAELQEIITALAPTVEPAVQAEERHGRRGDVALFAVIVMAAIALAAFIWWRYAISDTTDEADRALQSAQVQADTQAAASAKAAEKSAAETAAKARGCSTARLPSGMAGSLLSCPDGTISVVPDGRDGAPGAPGPRGPRGLVGDSANATAAEAAAKALAASQKLEKAHITVSPPSGDRGIGFPGAKSDSDGRLSVPVQY